jgi:hypothetical protein
MTLIDPCPHGGRRSECALDSCIDPEPLDLGITRELTNAYARACDELVLREAHRLRLPGTPEEQAEELVRRGYGFKYPNWHQMDASTEGRIGIKLPEFCILDELRRTKKCTGCGYTLLAEHNPGPLCMDCVRKSPCTCSASDGGADGMHAGSCPRCVYPSGLPQAGVP